MTELLYNLSKNIIANYRENGAEFIVQVPRFTFGNGLDQLPTKGEISLFPLFRESKGLFYNPLHQGEVFSLDPELHEEEFMRIGFGPLVSSAYPRLALQIFPHSQQTIRWIHQYFKISMDY